MGILIIFILVIVLIIIDKSKDDKDNLNNYKLKNNKDNLNNYKLKNDKKYKRILKERLEQRVIAFIIDMLVIYAIILIGSIFYKDLYEIIAIQSMLPMFLIISYFDTTGMQYIFYVFVISFVIETIYFFICNLIFDTSLGGYMMRLKTVNKDGSKLSVSGKFLRSLLKGGTRFLLGLPFIISFLTRNELWYDTSLNMKVISRDEEENEQLIEYIEDSVDDVCLKNNEECYEIKNEEDEYISKNILKRRIFAFFIDVICIWIIIGIAFLFCNDLFRMYGKELLIGYFVILIVVLISFIVPELLGIVVIKVLFEVVYYFICNLIFDTSLGGYIMRLKTVKKDGSKFSISDKIMRSIFKGVSCLLVIPFIPPCFTREELWYDTSLNTKVILRESSEEKSE